MSTNPTTALDVNRRGFLGMLFGAVATAVVAKVAPPVAKVVSRARDVISQNPVVVAEGAITPHDLATAFAQIERWDMPVTRVFMHPADYENLISYQGGHPLMDEDESPPKLWGASVLLDTELQKGRATMVSKHERQFKDGRGVAHIQVVS